MDKRYQIFISSTFSDLKKERNKVMQTIMSLDCIPAGMELFPAMDEEQFEFIKRIIDDCDYYLLIVGARYGSMDENGVSYTEKEYDYAVSKGIPVLAFLHQDISSLPIKKTDSDLELRNKLDTFCKKVKTGRLIQYWRNADDLNAKVAVSLPKTIKVYPRIGWVRANLQSNAESLQQINQLHKEISELKSAKIKKDNDLCVIEDKLKDQITGLNSSILITGENKHFDYKKQKQTIEKWHVELTFKDLFYELALYLLDENLSDLQARNRLSNISYKATNKPHIAHGNCLIELKVFQQIKLHFKLMGLIEICTKPGKKSSYWQLTNDGRNMILQSLCNIKK